MTRQVLPKVDYTMTGFGGTLVLALLPLCDWGMDHRARVERVLSRPGRRGKSGRIDARGEAIVPDA